MGWQDAPVVNAGSQPQPKQPAWAAAPLVAAPPPEPQDGDPFTGGELPQGFHSVTMDGGQQVLRRDLTGADIGEMASNFPGVGTIANTGKGIYDTGKKVIAGLAGLVTGGDADVVESVRDSGNVDMGNFGARDPIMQGLGTVMNKVGEMVAPIDRAVEGLPDAPRTIIQGLEEAIPDVAGVAGARVPLKGVGPTVGEAAKAVKDTVTLKAQREAYRKAAGVENDWFKAGLRTGGGHAIAREVSGHSGQEALTHANARVGNAIAAREAGHSDGPMTYESLAQSREPASSVYNRVARGLPEGPLDDAARTGIQGAGAPAGGRMSAGSPQAQQQIAALKEQLLDPERKFTGQQMVNELRGLRQEGYTNIASDDVSNQQLGKAQIAMARALEDHISRNIPKGGDVTLDQFTAARKELAKNWTVQAALRGEDVDLKAIGRVYRNDPELLDGGLKMLGEFAEGEGKDVVGIPDRYNPPNVLQDLSHVVSFHRPVQSTIQGIPGVGASARRVLTGNTDKNVESARTMFPPGAPDRFDPIAGLRAPPGRVGIPGRVPPEQMSLGDLAQADSPLPPAGMGLGDEFVPTPREAGIDRRTPNVFPPGSPAAGAPPRGIPDDVPLADVLAEGVPPSPAPGLSAGPMGSPRGQGLPFQLSPEVFGSKPRQGGAPATSRVTDDFGDEVIVERGNSPGDQNEVSRLGRDRTDMPLGDRFARPAEPEVAPPKGRVERFGDQSAEVGSEGRVVETRTGEPSLGDLLNDLNNLVGEGVPGDSMVRVGTRKGPSKPWLVDEDKPGNDRGFDNLMEDIHGDDPLSNNASGQTDVSQEFANWQAERKAAGITRYRFDPSSEEMVPLHSTTARDPSSVKGRPVFDQDAKGNFTVIDRGGLSQSELNGIIARMSRLGDVFQ